MKTVPCIAITLCLTLSGVVPAHAQSPARDLSTMSIEDLLSVEVVSASRKEQRLADVPAAVFVLTHDDIRSGMRAAGCPTMHDRALMLVAQGITSIDEVDRVLSLDAPAQPVSQSTAPRRQRVLVTDDEPTTRMLVRLLLEREQFEVIEASSGEEGVERAIAERPDVVLMDLNMPGIDGFEAIRRLRRHMSFAAVPIVVLTAE